jgi:hypothetical protein
MKNIILTAIFTLSFGALISCTKKQATTTNAMVFSINPLSSKNFLATAD